jgi:hypothetical protein
MTKERMTLLGKINSNGGLGNRVALGKVLFTPEGQKLYDEGGATLARTSQTQIVLLDVRSGKTGPFSLFPFFWNNLTIVDLNGASSTCYPGRLKDDNVQFAFQLEDLGHDPQNRVQWNNPGVIIRDWVRRLQAHQLLFLINCDGELYTLKYREDPDPALQGITSSEWKTSALKKVLIAGGTALATGAAAYGGYHLQQGIMGLTGGYGYGDPYNQGIFSRLTGGYGYNPYNGPQEMLSGIKNRISGLLNGSTQESSQAAPVPVATSESIQEAIEQGSPYESTQEPSPGPAYEPPYESEYGPSPSPIPQMQESAPGPVYGPSPSPIPQMQESSPGPMYYGPSPSPIPQMQEPAPDPMYYGPSPSPIPQTQDQSTALVVAETQRVSPAQLSPAMERKIRAFMTIDAAKEIFLDPRDNARMCHILGNEFRTMGDHATGKLCDAAATISDIVVKIGMEWDQLPAGDEVLSYKKFVPEIPKDLGPAKSDPVTKHFNAQIERAYDAVLSLCQHTLVYERILNVKITATVAKRTIEAFGKTPNGSGFAHVMLFLLQTQAHGGALINPLSYDLSIPQMRLTLDDKCRWGAQAIANFMAMQSLEALHALITTKPQEAKNARNKAAQEERKATQDAHRRANEKLDEELRAIEELRTREREELYRREEEERLEALRRQKELEKELKKNKESFRTLSRKSYARTNELNRKINEKRAQVTKTSQEEHKIAGQRGSAVQTRRK